jgi:hypothetical protein
MAGAVMLQAPPRRQPAATFFANYRLKLIPKLISIHIQLAPTGSCYEFYTVFFFRLSIEWALCCGTHVVLIALYRGEATAVIPLTLWLLVG